MQIKPLALKSIFLWNVFVKGPLNYNSNEILCSLKLMPKNISCALERNSNVPLFFRTPERPTLFYVEVWKSYNDLIIMIEALFLSEWKDIFEHKSMSGGCLGTLCEGNLPHD